MVHTKKKGGSSWPKLGHTTGRAGAQFLRATFGTDRGTEMGWADKLRDPSGAMSKSSGTKHTKKGKK